MENSVSNGNKGSNCDLNSFEIVDKKDLEEKPVETSGWVDILGSGQLNKKVLKPGEPDTRPQRLEICLVSGFGKLADDTIVETFDNLEVCLGDGELVPGMDFVLPLMDVGEESLIEIGPRFGYGDKGNADLNIPPHATITYQLTLHSVQPEIDIAELSPERRLYYGSKKKSRGNWWYLRNENSSAVQSYRRALEFLDSSNINTSTASEEELGAVIKERINVYNNLAQAQINLESNDSALMSLENVLSLDPKNVKALVRKAKVLSNKNEPDEAISVLKLAQSLEPDNKNIQSQLSNLYIKQKSNVAKEKEIYKRMFTSATSSSSRDKDEEKPSGNSLTKIILVMGLTAITLLAAGGLLLKFYHADLFEHLFWSLD